MTAYFVTGTDTGVGKTVVSTGLLAAARARGLRAAGLKPVESGCQEREGELIPADAERLRAAAGSWLSLDEVCLRRYRAPVAPSVAARQEGSPFDRAETRALVARTRDAADLVLVEGAGGLLVPLDEEWTMADLAADLDLPIIIVARDALGTINHTVLTVEAATARGLVIAGIVLSAIEAGTESAAQENVHEIERGLAGRARILGRLPHLESPSPEELATACEQHLDLEALFHVEPGRPD